MSRRFAVGDRVRYKTHADNGRALKLRPGWVGTIVEVDAPEGDYTVEWDRDETGAAISLTDCDIDDALLDPA